MALKTGGVRHYTVTLTGSAQNLATVLIAAGTLSAAEDGPYQQLILYADDGNGNIVAVGGDSGVTTSDYGVALDAEESLDFGSFLSAVPRLRDIWVIGTNTQKIHVLVVVH